VTESCSKKEALLFARQEAADEYAKAVADLAKKIGIVSAVEYRRLRQAAEIARKLSQRAHADFEKHISDHGCGDVLQSQAS
jgi:hypothetical protein